MELSDDVVLEFSLLVELLEELLLELEDDELLLLELDCSGPCEIVINKVLSFVIFDPPRID